MLTFDARCRLSPNRIRYTYLWYYFLLFFSLFSLQARWNIILLYLLFIVSIFRYSITACLAWTCSAWFHARDNKTSELADYSMSDLFIATGAAVTLHRLFDLRGAKMWLIQIIGFALFFAQVL